MTEDKDWPPEGYTFRRSTIVFEGWYPPDFDKKIIREAFHPGFLTIIDNLQKRGVLDVGMNATLHAEVDPNPIDTQARAWIDLTDEQITLLITGDFEDIFFDCPPLDFEAFLIEMNWRRTSDWYWFERCRLVADIEWVDE